MSVRDKWLVGIGALLAGVATGVLLLYWLLLPAYVERFIQDALRQRGLTEATFSLGSMSLSHLNLHDLRLDDARTLTVKRIEVDYSLADLMGGRVREVRLIDAQWNLELSKDYAVDWGAASKVVAGTSTGPPPIARVRWIQSRLLIQTPTRNIAVPVAGTATFSGPDTQLDVRGELFHEPLHVHASTHSQGRAGRLWATLRGPDTVAGSRDSITATVRFADQGGAPTADIEVRGQRRSVRAISGEREWALADVVAKLNIRVEGDEVMDAHGELSASAVSASGFQVLTPRLALERAEGALKFELSARVEECRISIRGALSPRPREWNESGPFDSAWQVTGALPSPLATLLGDAGITAPDLRIVNARGRAVVERTGHRWQGQVFDGSATIAAKRLSMPKQRLSIRRPSASILFYARMDELGGEIALRNDSELAAQALRWRTLSMDGARSASPAVRVRMDDDRTVFGWNRESLWWRSGQIRTTLRSNIRYGDALHVSNLRGTLAMSLSPKASGPEPRILWSTLQADGVRAGAVTIPAVSARIRGRPTNMRIDADAQLTKSAKVSVSAALSGQGKGQRCPLEVDLPKARIEAGDRLATWIRGVVPVQLTGTLTLSARLDPCGPAPDAEGQLQLAGVTATHASGTLTGIHGTVAFLGTRPIRTKGWQTLQWANTKLAERTLGPGSLVFRSRSPGGFEVQQATLDVGGGTLQTSDFVVDPKQLEIKTTLFARQLSVKKWLPVVSRGRARGTGTLSGRLDVRVRWTPQLQLKLFGGHLSSDGGGNVAVLDSTWLRQALVRYAANIGLGDSKSDLIKDRVIGALMDFDYTALALRIKPETTPVLQVTTKGKGRRIPQELDLTVNVRGFEEAFNPALRAWLANKGQ